MGLWRYFDLLPVESAEAIISLGEGGTFLQRCDRLAEALGLRAVWVKNETTNPTGSFIDRGASVLVSRAREEGIRVLKCATTGNLGAAVAAYAAKAGIRCFLYLPKLIDLGKLYQMVAYGAEIRVADSYEEAQEQAASSVVEGVPIGVRNPFLMEGLKTTGYEIAEAFGQHMPSRIVVPVGNGAHLVMIWKGLQELQELGLLEGVETNLIGVQSGGSAPMVEAFHRVLDRVQLEEARLRFPADMATVDPHLQGWALRVLREGYGYATVVDDAEIVAATRMLAGLEGIFAEPAAASTVAAVKRLVEEGVIAKSEEVICIITGEGLKDPLTARRLVEDRGRAGPELLGEARGLRVLRGLKMELLRLLSGGESYGYGLAARMSRRVSMATIYQHLKELEELGLVVKARVERVRRGRVRVYYRLTEKGRRLLEVYG
jgi:threonine synthase